MLKRPMKSGLEAVPARQIEQLERRLFLRKGLGLGALALLSGCDVTEQESVQKVLWSMSRWNDRAQAWLFDPNRLAP
jgi:DMSO/TMAO reductase YedYZ molybdopterin-dependent catalytic subunit